MVQLRVEDGSNIYFLDLYATDPIKLTLSIEDITNADARSTFSRTFRVPATGTNNSFFKHAFRIDGIDYDVTVKKPAQILYNGSLFKEGHIRLQKIYLNGTQNQNDYEIVFLGETRDFASAVGEKTLAELNLSAYDHAINYTNVVASWQAWPEGAENDGLFNGDILYPMINFGRVEGENKISYGESDSFDQQNRPIYANRFKPMIRAKALWDMIFAEAGFTYTSAIADSNEFRQLYISAFGNEPHGTEAEGSANLLDVALSQDFDFVDGDRVPFDVVNLDPSNNYSTISYQYTVPVTGNYEINLNIAGAYDVDGPGTAVVTSNLMRNGSVLVTDSSSASSPILQTYNFSHYLTFSGGLTAGDVIHLEMGYTGVTNRAQIESNSTYWEIPSAAGNINIATQLDDKYKQIDFIKDMITKFRLAMAPDPRDPKNFIVEPWVDYIASGDEHDWSDKLDVAKDVTIEPLFFTQSARIDFTDKADSDWLNELNIKQFKEVFGALTFDAQNELLKGTREIKTNFASTPIIQIEGAKDSNFLLPRIYTRETDGGVTTTEPIKPVTRILFYNGLFTQAGTKDQNGNPIGPWYFFNEVTSNKIAQSQFPMVSYWQNFDSVTGPNASTVNLNWQIERGYAYPYANFNYTAGQSMYTRFWSDYIASLYDKDARRFTGYFALSADDLIDFSFDDVIFVQGNWYRPEKVQDVIVGEKSLVKVQLIKLLDYPKEIVIPVDPCDEADPFTILLSSTNETSSGANDGTITVTPQGGIAPYDITVNGTTLTSNNGEPVTFTNLAPNTYNVTAVDNCGSEVIDQVTIQPAVPAGNYYTIQLCINPGDTYVASYSPGGLTPGQSVTTTLDGGSECYEVLGTTTGPAQTTILGVYADCLTCNNR